MPLCRSLSDHVYDSRESWGFSSGILSRCRCKHARHMQCKYYIAGCQTELRTVSIKEGSAEWRRVCTVKARVLGSLKALLDGCIRLLRRPIYAEPVGDSASCSIVRSASYSLGPFIADAEMMVDFIHLSHSIYSTSVDISNECRIWCHTQQGTKSDEKATHHGRRHHTRQKPNAEEVHD